MIPVCSPVMTGKEKEYALDCIESNSIASGKYIGLFEEAFASFCGTKHCVSCCNGTAALHLCLAALNIGPGDQVIIPSFTMIAVCNAVIYTGATPVLVDSEPETWNMDPAKAADAVTPDTKAIIAVHTYGHPADMDRLNEIADKQGIAVIEDAAEAHGAEYKDRRAGSLGKLAAFSFYANKTITTGEGGAITTSDPKLAARLLKLRNHFFGEPRFVHREIGFNYRMSNIQAAIGLAQTENAEQLVELRRRNAVEYNRLLNSTPGIRTPREAAWAKNTYWMYGILVENEFPMDRDSLIGELEKNGIESRPFFYPMHLQPAYTGNGIRPIASGSLEIAERLGARGLYLPSGGGLSRDEIGFVSETIKKPARREP